MHMHLNPGSNISLNVAHMHDQLGFAIAVNVARCARKLYIYLLIRDPIREWSTRALAIAIDISRSGPASNSGLHLRIRDRDRRARGHRRRARTEMHMTAAGKIESSQPNAMYGNDRNCSTTTRRVQLNKNKNMERKKTKRQARNGRCNGQVAHRRGEAADDDEEDDDDAAAALLFLLLIFSASSLSICPIICS